MRYGNCSPSDGWHDIILCIVNSFEKTHIIHHLLKLSYRRYITLLLFDNNDALFLITCWHKNHTPQKVLTRQFWPRQREGLIAYCKIKLYTTQAFENSLLHEQISLCSTVIIFQSCIHEWYQLFSVQSSIIQQRVGLIHMNTHDTDGIYTMSTSIQVSMYDRK